MHHNAILGRGALTVLAWNCTRQAHRLRQGWSGRACLTGPYRFPLSCSMDVCPVGTGAAPLSCRTRTQAPHDRHSGHRACGRMELPAALPEAASWRRFRLGPRVALAYLVPEPAHWPILLLWKPTWGLLFRDGVAAEHCNRFKLGRSLDKAFSYGCNTLFSEVALAVCQQEGLRRRSPVWPPPVFPSRGPMCLRQTPKRARLPLSQGPRVFCVVALRQKAVAAPRSLDGDDLGVVGLLHRPTPHETPVGTST
jgi:hypothetical protein